MPELGPYGSVRGARGNSRPYRESERSTVRTTRLTLSRHRPAEIPKCGSSPAAHSRFILAAKITLLHFLTSSEISLAKSAGDPPRAVPPRLASRAWSFGSAMLTLTSLFSFSMTSSGVRFGPPMPNHALTS